MNLKGPEGKSKPMLDSAFLSAAQLRSLAPPKLEVGQRYPLPEETARQLSIAMTHEGDAYYRMYPASVTQAKLEAEVIAVTDDRVEVRIAGTLEGKKKFGDNGEMEAQATFSGLLVLDRKGELQSLLAVCAGRYRNTRSNGNNTIGGLLEWRK